MNDFKKFAENGVETSGWDSIYDVNPDERSGAIIFFDAWKSCSTFQFRVFHIEENYNIELKGKGFEELSRQTQFKHWKGLEGEELPHGEYLTIIVWKIKDTVGEVEVKALSELPYWAEPIVKWGDFKIKDFFDNECTYSIDQNKNFHLKECLTQKESKQYALDDRVELLHSI